MLCQRTHEVVIYSHFFKSFLILSILNSSYYTQPLNFFFDEYKFEHDVNFICYTPPRIRMWIQKVFNNISDNYIMYKENEEKHVPSLKNILLYYFFNKAIIT